MPNLSPVNLIDVGDGTLIVPPPAQPPPSSSPPPPPPPSSPAPPAPSSSPAAPPTLPGEHGSSGGADPYGSPIASPSPAAPPTLPGEHGTPGGGDPYGTPAPPGGGQGGAGGPVGGTDDSEEARRLAEANSPDLSDLPPWELVDPYSLQFEAVAGPPLKGGGALSAMAQAGADYGVDVLAIVANALAEGASGAIGDGGLAYGPFQDHLTEFRGRPFYGKGRDNPTVNAWAWTENGIAYSVRQMATGSPSARGLRGHAAVYAIVYGYERPADKAGAYRTRAAIYDGLVGRGSGWAAYAAGLMHGPVAGGGKDTTPIPNPSTEPYKPAGVVARWRDLVDVFRNDVPKASTHVGSLAKSLKGVFN